MPPSNNFTNPLRPTYVPLQPTYASIARTRYSDPVDVTGADLLGPEDIDRSDRLDELSPYATVPVRRGSPPWRTSATPVPIPIPIPQQSSAPYFTLDQLLGSIESGPSTLTQRGNRGINLHEGSWDNPSMEANRRPIHSTTRPLRRVPTRNFDRLAETDSEDEEGDREREQIREHERQMGRRREDEGGDGEWEAEREVGSAPSIVGGFYAQGNRTQEDLVGTLRRGWNNRSRPGLLSRLMDREIPLGLGARRSVEDVGLGEGSGSGSGSTGMTPTNLGLEGGVEPLVVRTAGIVRRRSHSNVRRTGIDGDEEARPTKKRKLDATAAPFIPKTSTQTRSHTQIQNRPSQPSYLQFTTLPLTTSIPTTFFPPTRLSHLALTTHGPTSHPLITFTSHPTPTGTEADASSLITTVPIPTGIGIHYYEATVHDAGDHGFLSVGWMSRGMNGVGELDLGRMVGWDKGSWGWHGDDGKLFEGKGTGIMFGVKWGGESISTASGGNEKTLDNVLAFVTVRSEWS